MVSSLQDLDLVVVGSIDEAVFVVDATGPVPGEFTFERFRLADSVERISLNLGDEPDDPSSHLAVGGQPELEVLPGPGIEPDIPHSSPPAISRSSSIDLVGSGEAPCAALSRATASMSRRAFSGERSR